MLYNRLTGHRRTFEYEGPSHLRQAHRATVRCTCGWSSTHPNRRDCQRAYAQHVVAARQERTK